MAKFLVVESGDHSPYAMYEASEQKPEDFIVDGKTFIHCLVMPGANPTYCNIVNDDGVWKATPKIDVEYVKAILKKRCDYAMGLIGQFAAENQLLGITVIQAAENFSVMSPIILAMQCGALETAIYLLKGIPNESLDGKFLTKPRLLKYVNLCEDFLGVSQSGAW